MKLTAAKVKHAKPGQRLGDGHGLFLQVTKANVASWVFRYQRSGREHWAGLGPIRDVTLAEAREAARDARRSLRQGIDPIAAKRQQAVAVSFREAAERLISQKFTGRWAKQWSSTLRRYVYPHLGDLPIAAIGIADVLRAVEPVWRQDVGRRVAQRIKAVIDAATARGERQGDNPASPALLKSLLAARPKQSNHHAAIDWREVPAFMAELRKQNGIAARALELTALCATRAGETIGALWSEIDLENREWKVPPHRMKNRKEHRIPLADRAVEILRALPQEAGSDFVFIGARRGKSIGALAMWTALKGMGRSSATVHGLRSSFRSWAAECTNYPNHVCEQALAHSVGSAIERAYQRSDLFAKRRRLMDDWAAFCSGAAPVGAER